MRFNELRLCPDFLKGDVVSNRPSDTVFGSRALLDQLFEKFLKASPLGKEAFSK